MHLALSACSARSCSARSCAFLGGKHPPDLPVYIAETYNCLAARFAPLDPEPGILWNVNNASTRDNCMPTLIPSFKSLQAKSMCGLDVQIPPWAPQASSSRFPTVRCPPPAAAAHNTQPQHEHEPECPAAREPKQQQHDSFPHLCTGLDRQTSRAGESVLAHKHGPFDDGVDKGGERF